MDAVGYGEPEKPVNVPANEPVKLTVTAQKAMALMAKRAILHSDVFSTLPLIYMHVESDGDDERNGVDYRLDPHQAVQGGYGVHSEVERDVDKTLS